MRSSYNKTGTQLVATCFFSKTGKVRYENYLRFYNDSDKALLKSHLGTCKKTL